MNFAKWEMAFQKRIVRLIAKEKIYKSYQEAAKRCPTELYEQESIIDLVTERARQFRDKLQSNGVNSHTENVGVSCILDAVNRFSIQCKSDPISVLDFGGGDGSYYWHVRENLPKDILLRWYVVETPAMVTAMQEYKTDELHFASSITEAVGQSGKNCDIVFASGAIQYTEYPWQTLTELLAIAAPYMIFNRQSLSLEDFDIISIQRSLLSWHSTGAVPDDFVDRLIKYPHTSIRLSLFEEQIKKKYNVIYTVPESSGVKHTNKLKVTGLSYLCEQKH